MRAVVQRVAWAKVCVADQVVGQIEHGLLVLVGCGKGDETRDADALIDKLVNLRIFENDDGKMDKSVLDVHGSLLVVSQFTLFGDVSRGRRPSFDGAMPPELAEPMYNTFVTKCRALLRTETGRFRAHMRVTSLNDGPVTLWLDSRTRPAP
jgi:D-tyrosyl-tRNA(Tyr) deacylase